MKKIIDEKYNTFIPRFFASIVDFILFIIVFAIASFYSNYQLSQYFLTNFLFAFSFPLYYIMCHKHFGYTIGKKLLRVKVLHISEARLLNYKEAIFRDIYFIIQLFILMILWIINKQFYDNADVILDKIEWFWITLEFVTMIFSEKRRAFHDMIANSVVVKIAEPAF